MRHAAEELIADRYRLLARIGQGGQGRVWHAWDEMLHRDVAIKELVLPAGTEDDERAEMHARTLREARAVALVANQHVVRVYDVVQHYDEPWIVMELIDATSLDDAVHDGGPATPEEAAQIGLALLSALRAAHRAGVLHRDVKPANVLLAEDGRVLLTDFGMAQISGDGRLTETGVVMGSPAFMAPERALGLTVGPAADLWSLGATMYAAVEGRTIYARTTSVSMLAAVATQPPDPPENAGPLAPVLDGLLQRDPADRLTLEQTETMLREVVAGKVTVAIEAPVRPSRSPNRRTVLLAVAAVIALLAAGSIPLWHRGRTAAAVSDPQAAAGPAYQVIGASTGLCMEALGATQRTDRPVRLEPCLANHPGQRWTFAADGTVRTGGRCLATTGDATKNGTTMVVSVCRPGAASQTFRLSGAADLVNARTGACVSTSGRTADTALQIGTCGAAAAQKWRRSPADAP